jgi:hypothetical protein
MTARKDAPGAPDAPGEPHSPDADALSVAGEALEPLAAPLLRALEGDVAHLDAISRALFGTRPEDGFEEATIAHARTSELEGVAAPGELEELVRLSFRRARGETTAAEDARLEALERAMGRTAPAASDHDSGDGGS